MNNLVNRVSDQLVRLAVPGLTAHASAQAACRYLYTRCLNCGFLWRDELVDYYTCSSGPQQDRQGCGTCGDTP